MIVLRGAVIATLVTAVLAGERASAQDTASKLVGDPEARAAIEHIVNATRDAGLPVDPILAKVRYGVIVAHAAPARIVNAARQIASRLESARAALAPQPSSSDIAAGADALGLGATTEALRAVRAASPTRPVATPLGVLAQLVTTGVSPERATQIVTDLLRRGATGPQLVALGTDVDADVANGARALTALDTRLRGLTAVLGGGGSAAASPTAVSPASGQGKKP